MLEYRETETEFFNEEDNSSLIGTAFFTYHIYADGWSAPPSEWGVRDVYLKWILVNGYALSRAMLIKMFGAEAVYRVEEVQAERLQEKLAAGDLLAAE